MITQCGPTLLIPPLWKLIEIKNEYEHFSTSGKRHYILCFICLCFGLQEAFATNISSRPCLGSFFAVSCCIFFDNIFYPLFVWWTISSLLIFRAAIRFLLVTPTFKHCYDHFYHSSKVCYFVYVWLLMIEPRISNTLCAPFSVGYLVLGWFASIQMQSRPKPVLTPARSGNAGAMKSKGSFL